MWHLRVASRKRVLQLVAVLLGIGLFINFQTMSSSHAKRTHDDATAYIPTTVVESEAPSHRHSLDDVSLLRPFLENEVKRGVTCSPSSVVLSTKFIGPSRANTSADMTSSPQCACVRSVAHDIDHGKTLYHLLKRHYCQSFSSKKEGLPMRIVQVGANTGDNANDHLVTFLRSGVANGVLLEPVPWIFKRLSKTYSSHRTVRLVNAAMSEVDGNTSFVAPSEKASGWLPQMGGLQLPPKTLKSLKKHGGSKMFDHITVQSVRFDTLLRQVDWVTSPPDVFVVDAEGYDSVIMTMVLDAVATMYGAGARIPIIQFEWKHVSVAARSQLWERLEGLGYCVMQVHYDDIAVHSSALLHRGESCEASFDLVL